MKLISSLSIAILAINSVVLNAQVETISVTPVQPRSFKEFSTIKLPTLDLYGAVPVKQCGWGLGMNILTKGITVAHFAPRCPIQMQFGGEMYWAQLYHRNMGEVPLASVQTGNAKVKLTDNVFGLNALTRISMPINNYIIPYVDVFAGLRSYGSGMNITPVPYPVGNQRSNYENLCSSNQLNYGITGGLMIKLGESVRFNTALMYSFCKDPGEMVNLSSAHIEGNGIVADKMATPTGMLIAKVGFTFLISRGNGTSSCSGGRRSRVGTGSFFGSGGGGGGGSHVNFNFRPSR